MLTRFHTFGSSHLITVTVIAVVITAMILIARRGPRAHTWMTGILAFCNLAAYPFSQAALSTLDPTLGANDLDNSLPFHLCDVAAFIAGFALLTRQPTLCLLTYFWGLAATLQGLLTPAVPVDAPHPVFFSFFLAHGAVVGAALYLPLADGWRPKGSWLRAAMSAFAWANVYLLCAMIVNKLLGTNFGFLTKPPSNPSIVDHLGPHPWYILSFEGLAVTFFLLLALPFRASQRSSAISHQGER